MVTEAETEKKPETPGVLRRAVANRRRVWRHTMRLAGFAFLVLLLAIRFWDPAPVEILRLKTLDLFQFIEPRATSNQPVRVVDIDERSLLEHGQWPWPRTLMAELTRKLFGTGAVTVGFDIVFSEPDRLTPSRVAQSLPGLSPDVRTVLEKIPDNDEVFASTLAQYPTVLGRFLRTRDEGGTSQGLRSPSIATLGANPRPFLEKFDGVLANLPILEKSVQGVGMAVPTQERDNIIRRVPALVGVGKSVQPTLALEMLRVATGQKTYVVKTDADAGIAALSIGENRVRTDDRGRIWVHYSSPRPDLYVSAADILSGKVDAELIAGHLVLIGTSAVGLRDLRATPLRRSTPGVEIHAQLLETILSGSSLERPNFAIGAELTALLVIGLLIILLIPRIGAWRTLVLGGTLGFLMLGGAWWLFLSHQMLIDVSYPLISSFAVFAMLSFMNYVREQADRRQIRSAFSRYLAPEIVNRLSDNPAQLRLGGEMREMTLLFSDVQGFTGIAEHYDAVGLTQLINDILTPITGEVLKTGGTVDKYMGDALMAFWNAPLDDAEHARNACISALAIRAGIGPLNDRLKAKADAEGRGFSPVNVGVGLNTGECCVGNMGSEQRFDYSVLGDSVNLASRLEGQTRTYGVWIVAGEKTTTLAKGMAFLELDLITVKGKTIPERIFALLGDEKLAASAEFKVLSRCHNEMLAAYRQQDWGAASDALAAARSAAGAAEIEATRLYDVFAGRIAGFRDAPPPPDWDGVYVALTKG